MVGELIAKEEIPQFKFIPASEDKSASFMDKLKGALRLGNEFKSKTEIAFQTDSGDRKSVV